MIKYVDLRENRIGRSGIKTIIEALERSPRVAQVRVCKEGRIEAFGVNHEKQNTENQETTVDSIRKICLVDIRDNYFHDCSSSFIDDFIGLNVDCEP
jgi:hypothetical protein